MSWFKENKFLGGLLVVTVLLAAIIISFGMKAGTSLEEVQQQVTGKKVNQPQQQLRKVAGFVLCPG